MCRDEIRELHVWINCGKKVYSFLKAGSVKICNTLDLQSQGNELIGKGNEAKQLGKNLSKTLHGMQIISESWRLNRTYFGLKNTYFLARHIFYFIRSNFFSFGKLQLKIYSHWLKKNNVWVFIPKVLFSLLWNSLMVKYYSYKCSCAFVPLHQLYEELCCFQLCCCNYLPL